MSLTLLLRSEDLALSRNFYRGVLGFSVEDTAEDTLTVEKEGGKLIFTQKDLWTRNRNAPARFISLSRTWMPIARK